MSELPEYGLTLRYFSFKIKTKGDDILEPNYKEMYFKLMAATEDAIETLIAAQRECEEIYMTGCIGGNPPTAWEAITDDD